MDIDLERGDETSGIQPAEGEPPIVEMIVNIDYSDDIGGYGHIIYDMRKL
jgi:hypothetical protein